MFSVISFLLSFNLSLQERIESRKNKLSLIIIEDDHPSSLMLFFSLFVPLFSSPTLTDDNIRQFIHSPTVYGLFYSSKKNKSFLVGQRMPMDGSSFGYLFLRLEITHSPTTSTNGRFFFNNNKIYKVFSPFYIFFKKTEETVEGNGRT